MSLVTDEPKLYSISEIQGKGLGCVATTVIKKRTLILGESASFHHSGESEYLDKAYLDEIFQGFLTMSAEDKEKYLSLSNCFSNQNTSPSSSTCKMASILKYLESNPIGLPRKQAELVYQIYHTNSFHNGIFLEMSRFNHSCIPNAECFWNKDTKTLEMRAVKKIGKDGEITISYLNLNPRGGKHDREERRAFLMDLYHFHCNCIGCDISEDELKIQDEKCAEYSTIWAHMKEQKRVSELMRSSDTSSEIDDLKALYKVAKGLKILGHRYILTFITGEGFDAACRGYLTMVEMLKSTNSTVHKKGKKDNFWRNIACFANAGYDLSKNVNGTEHPDTLGWQERKQDPIAFFKNKYGINIVS